MKVDAHKLALIAVSALPLLACQSQAASDRQWDDLNGAVKDAMCAQTMEDRAVALDELAAQVEHYQAHADEETASGAVESMTGEIDASDCASAAAPPSEAAPPPA